jgi:hypothetical protein
MAKRHDPAFVAARLAEAADALSRRGRLADRVDAARTALRVLRDEDFADRDLRDLHHWLRRALEGAAQTAPGREGMAWLRQQVEELRSGSAAKAPGGQAAPTGRRPARSPARRSRPGRAAGAR